MNNLNFKVTKGRKKYLRYHGTRYYGVLLQTERHRFNACEPISNTFINGILGFYSSYKFMTNLRVKLSCRILKDRFEYLLMVCWNHYFQRNIHSNPNPSHFATIYFFRISTDLSLGSLGSFSRLPLHRGQVYVEHRNPVFSDFEALKPWFPQRDYGQF